MRVILLQDVKKVGKKGQTVEVSDGYATNFLLPKRLAVKETKKSMEILDKQNEDARIAKENQKIEAEKINDELKNITLEFKLKANGEKVFGSVSPKQIEEQLKAKYNVTIDKRKITTKGPFNQLGYVKVEIELYKGVVGIINVHIVEE